MAWIEVHQSLPMHPKTIEAAMLLEVPEAEVVGHMVCLWIWAVDARPDGVLDLTKPRIIARAAGWEKEPGRFVDALIAVRFLDEDGAIHDWDDYTGRLMERRERTNEQTRVRMQAYRDRRRSRLSSIEAPVTQDVTRNKLRSYAAVTPGYAPTQPNPTVPNQPPTTKRERGPAQEARGATAPTTRAVQEVNKLLHKRCDETERNAVNAAVPDGDEAALRLWVACLAEWRLRYPNNRGLSGPLDWFGTGGPPQKRRNGRAERGGSSAVSRVLGVIDDEFNRGGRSGMAGAAGLGGGEAGGGLPRRLPG